MYALRPTPFHKKPEQKFASINEFVLAIKSAREMFPIENMIDTNIWYKKVSEGYIENVREWIR